ncbi:MAG TPA: PTS sugar transporter subunit IIC [Anaeromyxobacteraceae bacterium]|nr:PTS sugar transporter subunit IIC [Anaeromyxobacteraceae bacterium]
MSYLVVGLIAGFAAVERKGFLQAMISRPIAVAPLAGLALGDVPGALFVGAALELLWLGAVNLGAALPVHETLGAVASAAGAVLAGRVLGTGVTPAVAVLSVLLCAPLALVGRRADVLSERLNEELAVRAEQALAGGDPRAALRCNLYGLALPFVLAAAAAPLAAVLVGLAVPALLVRVPSAAGPLQGAWVGFVALAAAAAARALRARRAGPLFLAAFAVTVALGALLGRLR